MRVPEDIDRRVRELVAEAKVEGIDRLAVGAAIKKDKALLLVQRAQDDFLPGYTEIPGGWVEEGEDIFAALERETLEETRLVITVVLMCLEPFDFVAGSIRVRQLNFLVTTENEPVQLDPAEHSSYVWHDAGNSFDGKTMTPEMRRLIESAAAVVL